MGTQLTVSQHALQLAPLPTAISSSPSSADAQNAWHIFGLLLSIGRPALPIELASSSGVFMMPEYIQFLCRIPNSPLHLTSHSFVTISSVGCFAIARFMSNSNRDVDLEFSLCLGFEFEEQRPRSLDGASDMLCPHKRRKKHRSEDDTDMVLTRRNFFKQLKDKEETSTVLRLTVGEDRSSAQGFKNEDSAAGKEAKVNKENLPRKINFEVIYQKRLCDPLTETDIYAFETVLGVNMKEERGKEPMIDDDKFLGHLDNISVDATLSDRFSQGDAEEKMERIGNALLSHDKEKSKTLLINQMVFPIDKLSDDQMQLGKSPAKCTVGPREALTCKPQTISKSPEKNDVIKPSVDQQLFKQEKKPNSIKQYICGDSKNQKEKKDKHKQKKEKLVQYSEIHQLEQKDIPNFDSYVVEEEEGSGGYGTVFRARRKKDGLTFAIKCPHVNANKNHVQNEVKMLERFGGKNFVIKYEGSLKCGSTDCLVLEHVEHDRPEVLKREINISQLRWYGFCMFKALAALHKQGIVHRDVKPGNFLFSRKANKGFLIDFNLALDLHQRYGITEKKKSSNDSTCNYASLSSTSSLPPIRNKKSPCIRALDIVNHRAEKVPNILPKNLKRKGDLANSSSRNTIKSQGADGSGITSAKDATSNPTPSTERMREPIPCQGRKELLNLAQEALQITSHESVKTPASKRKRVAATPGNVDRKFVYLTPMPLHSTGIPVTGAGVLKNRGDGKQKREGPCVGTKGFRAPEVLVRSLHQGQKVDMWSAGVTLLYLMIGRTPFVGDPDQNIKEIAKLRGIEDLWEVAKLHNRESSFPADLLDIKYLPAVRLKEWCRQNTRRPDLLEIIPSSLLDLVDKCLTVNPRLRISAEEALEHEFIAPCHDTIKKHRLQRQGLSLDSGISSSSSQRELHGGKSMVEI